MKSGSESFPVVHNEPENRFEVELDGEIALLEYRVEGDRMIFTHTEVPPRFRRRRIAEKLVLAGFGTAKERNLKIVPLCSYVARVLAEHPEFDGSSEAAGERFKL
jgi:predicted GNAT family acetyltransferase